MTTFEIQIRGRFVYVTAATQDDALKVARQQHMTASERHWTQPIFTGRDTREA